MPDELLDSGCPPLTRRLKEKILGQNAAAMLGLDIAALQQQTAGDRFSSRELSPPWGGASLVGAG
jgi:hypothetical protein